VLHGSWIFPCNNTKTYTINRIPCRCSLLTFLFTTHRIIFFKTTGLICEKCASGRVCEKSLPVPDIFPLLLHHGREHGRLKSSIIFFAFLFIFFPQSTSILTNIMFHANRGLQGAETKSQHVIELSWSQLRAFVAVID